MAKSVGSEPLQRWCVRVCMYADTWYTNGTVLVPNTGLEGYISGTYQPVWDSWQRFIQPLVSNVSCLADSLLKTPY